MSKPNGNHGDTRTFRGASLEELLPQIREELGPDAPITRQRDGIVGGIGGFFGKKTVEVEAQPAGSPLPPPSGLASQPPRLDLYDTSESEAEEARPTTHRLLDELYRQASPFAERLTEAAEDQADDPEEFVRFEPPVYAAEDLVADELPAESVAVEEPVAEALRIEPEPAPRREAPRAAAPSAPLADALALRAALAGSG